MKNRVSFAMIVVGVGLVVLGFSDYVPAGTGDYAGWSESCRYVMTVGAMLAAAACSAVERPISPPVAVTYEFKAMFCALNGAVRRPCRAKIRHRAVTVILLPT